MSLDQIIKQRRSIRKYKKKPVSNEQIQLLIQAAVEAPSWKNSQTARYHVITSQPLLNEFKRDVYRSLIKKIVKMHRF